MTAGSGGPADLDAIQQVWEHARAAAAGDLKPSECDTCAAAIDAVPALVAEVRAARAAVERVRARAALEISDAEAGAAYAGEVNQGALLAAENARRFAWESAVRALDPGAEPGEQR